MKLLNLTLIGLLCATCAAGAFLVSAAKSAATATPDPVAAVLQLSNDQSAAIYRDDPNFAAESDALAANVRQQRQNLADMLQNQELQDNAVLAQLDNALAADAALQHRVIKHVLTMRQRLTAAQCQQLMMMSAQCMRGSMAGRGMGQGMGGMGMGMGQGMGPGMGRGPMYRGGRGMGDTMTTSPTTGGSN